MQLNERYGKEFGENRNKWKFWDWWCRGAVARLELGLGLQGLAIWMEVWDSRVGPAGLVLGLVRGCRAGVGLRLHSLDWD